MKIQQCKNPSQVANIAAQQLINLISDNSQALLCLAAGNSPLPCYQKIVNHYQHQTSLLKNLRFIGLDEWVGLNGTIPGSCRDTLNNAIFDPLAIAPEQISFFDGKATDLKKQCDINNHYLAIHGPIDCAILGLGVNGHIGFNEPSEAFSTRAHITQLAAITQQRGTHYFDTHHYDLSRGISLGIEQLMQAKKIILVVTGEQKQSAITHLLNDTITPQFPASILKQHTDCVLLTDCNTANQ